jgi:hypothetical protein
VQGNPRPFEDTTFDDISPVVGRREAPPLPHAPPMRGDGM